MKRILLIDDEEEIRQLLSRCLQGMGYETACAADGDEARRLVAGFGPDLIITDLQLADSDGIEVVTGLRQMVPGVKVVLLTGVNFEASEIDLTFGGIISAYIPKPARLSQIAQTVASLIGPATPGPGA
jgi:CheY-like chemotaxis protein